MKTIFVTLLFLSGLASGQTADTTVTLTGAGPLSSKATAKITWKNSQVTFAIGNCTIDGTGACALPISISNRTGYFPAGLQFDLTYGVDIASTTVAVGPVATAAQKTIACSPIAGGIRCLISGLNQTTMPDGVVAIASIQTSLTATDASTVAILGTVTASAKGVQIASVVTVGGGVVTMPALMATVTCDQPDIWTDKVLNCLVTLNKQSAADLTIALTSDSPLVVLPLAVTLPKGMKTVSFTATGT